MTNPCCKDCPARYPACHDHCPQFTAWRIEKSIAKLQRCFPGSYITDRNELIVHPRTNQYIILENIGTEDAIKAKVLEWLSRAAFKTAPYSQEWRNRKFHKYMRDGINAFLDTDFSEDDM